MFLSIFARFLYILVSSSFFFQSIVATNWGLSDTITQIDFYQQFTWYTDTDPTKGNVNYQSLESAMSTGITTIQNDQFIMAVDTNQTAYDGRNSVRITSQKSYSDGIYVLNVSHVPSGCSVWPAWWTVTDNISSWPVGGEIDIIENANDQHVGALAALHTDSNCITPLKSKALSGTILSNNCSAHTVDNAGCQTEMNGGKPPAWGSALNKAGGGIYAMERSLGSTGNGVKMWFWRQGKEPKDLIQGSTTVDPDSWGKPGADFAVADNCHSDFGPHNIVFDITLCGSFANSTYQESGCAAKYPSCYEQVTLHGDSYLEAYWAINDLRIFDIGGDTDNAANSPNTFIEVPNAISSGHRSVDVAHFEWSHAHIKATAASVVAVLVAVSVLL